MRELPRERDIIMEGTMPDARRRGRPRTAWMDNIKTWTGLSVEESTRMTEDRDKWRKYVLGVANRRIEDGQRTEQNTEHCFAADDKILTDKSPRAVRLR